MIVDCRSEDKTVKDVNELARAIYTDGELTNPDYLRWEYFNNPAGCVEGRLLQDEKGCLAHYAVLPVNFQLNGTMVKGSLSLNTMTREDQRGKGYFRQLAQQTYAALPDRQIDFTVGFPNHQSLQGFTRSLGFQLIGTVPMLIKPLNYLTVLRRLIFKKTKRKGKDLDLVISPSSRFRSGKWCVRVLDPVADAPLLTGLLEDLLHRHRCSTHRSIDYLNWRYNDCPTRTYTMLGISSTDDEVISSYIVMRAVELFGMRCGVIVDLGCAGGENDEESLGILLQVAEKQIRKAKLDAVIAACTNGCKESKHLLDAGFLSIPEKWHPQPLRMVLRLHRQFNGSEQLQSFNNWFVTFGDYDVL